MQVRDLPDGHRGQIFGSELYVGEPPSPARAHALAEIAAMLVAGSPLGDPAPKGWSFLSNAEIAAGSERLLVADVAGWTVDEAGKRQTSPPITTPPAWVCEVLEPATRSFTLTAKRNTYAELGVQSLWIADPDAQVLEIFQNQRGRWLLLVALSDERAVGPAPFEGVHFDANDLWLNDRWSARGPNPPSPRHRS